jgi:hypothetical protein
MQARACSFLLCGNTATVPIIHYHSRPGPAIHLTIATPRCGPSNRPFAATAKSRRKRTHSLRDFPGFRCAMHEGPLFPFFQGGLTFEKCVDHRTFWCGVACTSSDGFRQDTFDPREIGYFRLHIFKMRLSNGLDLSAGLRPVIDQPEQPANFFQ